MDKKDLKWYESPVTETVELKLEGFLCASGDETPKGFSGDSFDDDFEDDED